MLAKRSTLASVLCMFAVFGIARPADDAAPRDFSKEIKVLSEGKDAEKLETLKQLRAVGKDAAPAAKAVAAAMLSSNEKVKEAAIDAFGKIDSDLLKSLLPLLDSDDASEVRTSLWRIHASEALTATPIVVDRIKRDCKKQPMERFDYVENGITALAKIGVDDADAVSILILLMEKPFREKGRDTRKACAEALGSIAAGTHGELRTKSIASLNKSLTAYQKKKNPDENDTHTCTAQIVALAKYGKDAMDAIPVLKMLRRAKSDAVRQAAIDAINAIE